MLVIDALGIVACSDYAAGKSLHTIQLPWSEQQPKAPAAIFSKTTASPTSVSTLQPFPLPNQPRLRPHTISLTTMFLLYGNRPSPVYGYVLPIRLV